MAGNWKSTREIGNLGKRVVKLSHIFKPHPPAPTPTPTPCPRRTAHTSAYDKNVDDQVGPSVVPDEVIEPQSEKYWAPNPQTGVFGPATSTDAGGGERGCHSSPANGPEESVLEEKAWFRPTSLEDLEKPHHH